jgi:hypothetical protein
MPKLAVFFLAASAIAQAPIPPQPVATMNQLMLDVIDPTSNAISYRKRQ